MAETAIDQRLPQCGKLRFDLRTRKAAMTPARDAVIQTFAGDRGYSLTVPVLDLTLDH